MIKVGRSDKETDYRFELDEINNFHDGNVNIWFKENVEEAQFNIEMQNDKLASLRKGGAPAIKTKQPQTRDSLPKPEPASSQQSGFDINQLNSFKVLEDQLDEQVDNKNNYRQILEKKQRLLGMVKQGSLTAEKYKALLVKSIAEAKKQRY